MIGKRFSDVGEPSLIFFERSVKRLRDIQWFKEGPVRLSQGPAVVRTRAIAAFFVNRSLEDHQSLSMIGHIFYSNDVMISAVRLFR